jgi:hypothetical protein
MLAMEARAPRAFRQPALSLTSIASVLAPTGSHNAHKHQKIQMSAYKHMNFL